MYTRAIMTLLCVVVVPLFFATIIQYYYEQTTSTSSTHSTAICSPTTYFAYYYRDSVTRFRSLKIDVTSIIFEYCTLYYTGVYLILVVCTCHIILRAARDLNVFFFDYILAYIPFKHGILLQTVRFFFIIIVRTISIFHITSMVIRRDAHRQSTLTSMKVG